MSEPRPIASSGLEVRVASPALRDLVELVLARLQFAAWFDEGVVERIIASGRMRLPAEEELGDEPDPVDIVLSELLVHGYCEVSLPVGYRLTDRGVEVGRRRTSELGSDAREAISFEVAAIYTGLARKGGGRGARRALVESARQASREATDGLTSAVLLHASRYAANGHSDLLPVILDTLFSDGRGRVITLEDGLELAASVSRGRDWTSTSEIIGLLQAAVMRADGPSPRSESASPPSAVVTARQLLAARVQIGTSTRRWNPRSRRFIFGEKFGHYIIDLRQTLRAIEKSYIHVRDLVASDGFVLFVGLSSPASDPVADFASRCGMPYVNRRWLGGMLTNFSTVSRRIEKMHEYQAMRARGEFELMPKKEALLVSRELAKLERNLGGMSRMRDLPDSLFIVGLKEAHYAVKEANRLDIPVIGLVDTDCDPDPISYPIPGNDDGIASVSLMCRVICDAVQEGRLMSQLSGRPQPDNSSNVSIQTGKQPGLSIE